MQDLDDDSELGAFRLRADAAFVQGVADILKRELPECTFHVDAHRRYLRIAKELPDGKLAALHGYLTWTDYAGAGGRSDYFRIEFGTNEENGGVYVVPRPLTPRAVADKVLEILSQLNDTP